MRHLKARQNWGGRQKKELTADQGAVVQGVWTETQEKNKLLLTVRSHKLDSFCRQTRQRLSLWCLGVHFFVLCSRKEDESLTHQKRGHRSKGTP